MIDADPYAEWDAAYVLGALSVGDRAAYEDHLAGCDRCRGSVAELAGLPGLLGQLSPGEAMALETTEPVPGRRPVPEGAPGEPFVVPEPPASLMPRLPRAGGAPRWLAPLAAAAAVLLIGGIGGYAVSSTRDATPGTGPTSTLALARTRLAFAPVVSSPMTAVVDVVPTGEGTELRVECQYAAGAATSGATGSGSGTSGVASSGATGSTGSRVGVDGYTGVRYAVWVVGRDGRQMEVKDWVARTGRIMHPSGVTSWPVAQIASVEIRLAETNQPVMRARLA